jgi:hypothetical protein
VTVVGQRAGARARGEKQTRIPLGATETGFGICLDSHQQNPFPKSPLSGTQTEKKNTHGDKKKKKKLRAADGRGHGCRGERETSVGEPTMMAASHTTTKLPDLAPPHSADSMSVF